MTKLTSPRNPNFPVPQTSLRTWMLAHATYSNYEHQEIGIAHWTSKSIASFRLMTGVKNSGSSKDCSLPPGSGIFVITLLGTNCPWIHYVAKDDVELLLSARITMSPHPVSMIVEIALRALCTLGEPSVHRNTSTAWSPALARGFRAVRNVYRSGQPGPSFQVSQLSTAALPNQCQSTTGPQLGYLCQCSTSNRAH